MGITLIERQAKTSKADKASFLAAGITEEQAKAKLSYKFLPLSETKAYAVFASRIEAACADFAEALLPVGDKKPAVGEMLQEAISTLAPRLLAVTTSVTLQADSVRKLSKLPFAPKAVKVVGTEEDSDDNTIDEV
jgi:hypothetical protein